MLARPCFVFGRATSTLARVLHPLRSVLVPLHIVAVVVAVVVVLAYLPLALADRVVPASGWVSDDACNSFKRVYVLKDEKC